MKSAKKFIEPFDWRPSKTKPVAVDTAVWRRKNGDINVLRVQIEQKLFIGSDGKDLFIIASRVNLKYLAKLISLCRAKNVLLYVSGGTDSPVSMSRWNWLRTYTVLISRDHAQINLKEWRQIRNKLVFEPKRWQLPTNSELNRLDSLKKHWTMGNRGHEREDGSTFSFALNESGIQNFALIAWSLSQDPREMIYRALWLIIDDKDGGSVAHVAASDFKRKNRCW